MPLKQNYNKGFTQHHFLKQKGSAGFTSIDKLLKNTAKEYNLESAIYRHKTITGWQKVAPGFIEEAAEKTKALDFNKGVLTVACLSREVAYKIKLMAEQIIAALNEIIGKRVIYAIYVEV
jgi:predicted nucleic acid-binding Zn ribbon protein